MRALGLEYLARFSPASWFGTERQRSLELLLLDPRVARELGFDGVVAKNDLSLYRRKGGGWVKVKNPN